MEIEKLFRQNFNAFGLIWDTNYFGVKSGRVNLDGALSLNEQEELLRFIRKFEFVTISNKKNRPQNNIWISKMKNTFLTDINMQFLKAIEKPSFDPCHDVELFDSYPKDESILDLSLNAFKYSRFYNDPFLNENMAKNIYVQWCNSAFDKSDRFFVIAKKNGRTIGFLLFSIKNEDCVATIELIAVDEMYRGQNVGTSLLQGLEIFLYEKQVRNIRVGTQVENVSAVGFYLAHGFKYIECFSIYHHWLNRET